MNVFGKNERSWRKARKRGVSPIIATILLVAITVVLAAVLYVLISGLTGGGVGSKPIGSAFTVGPNPSNSASKCPVGDTFATNGCLAGDYVYSLTIESSSVNFGQVLFTVKTSTGAPVVGTAGSGFTILNTAGVVAAQVSTGAAALSMTGWTAGSYGAAGVCVPTTVACSGATSLTNLYSIVIDMGTASPAGLGDTFTVLGTAGFTGTTGQLVLS